MSFVAKNGYDVEYASSRLVMENLFPEIQHLNGKGVIDTYTKTEDVESVTLIDVMRVLPYAPRFRQLGSANNGTWHNQQNEGGFGNAPQSTKYTIPVDLIYDEGVAITSPQIYSNPTNLQAVVMKQLVQAAGMSINVITYAKQLEGFFRNGDNFDKALAHDKGNIAQADITAAEIANAVFGYTANDAASATNAFISANETLTDGIPEIGAFVVPADERQGFITTAFNRLMKGQYLQNASDSSARILATGFINPFTESEDKRIDVRTGLAGMYDGVDLFIWNKVVKQFTYTALGVEGNANVIALLDQIGAMIVYGAGTCRGIVGPTVDANPNPFFGGVYLLPQMKVGVEVLHGATIKLVISGTWTAANIATLMNTLAFTPIDGKVVKGSVAGFNDGTKN